MHRVSAAKSFRWKSTATAVPASVTAQLRENARPCGRIYAGSSYDVAQTRAVLVIVRSAAKMERWKFRRGKIPSR